MAFTCSGNDTLTTKEKIITHKGQSTYSIFKTSEIFGLFYNTSTTCWILFFYFSDGRRCGRTVREVDLKSGDPEFKFCSDKQMDLFQVVSGSTLWLYLYMAYWSVSCLSAAICIV